MGRIFDWFVFRFLWPIVRKRMPKHDQESRRRDDYLVVKYEEIMGAIHKDKLVNKPGVLVFVSRRSGDTWEEAGFLYGRDVLEIRPDGYHKRHILALLHESTAFAVGRIQTTPERTAFIQKLLREIAGATLYTPSVSTGAEFVAQICSREQFKPQDGCDMLVFEPDGLYASMTLLFEHKGE